MPDRRIVVVKSRKAEEQDADRAKKNAVGDKLALARRQFRTINESESTLRENMRDDLNFAASLQWDADDLDDREQDQRPAMTFNRLGQFIRQVVNQSRVSRPGIEVHPVDNGADPETAEVFQGVIRHIEQESDAQRAYITAAEAQARMGRGYIRVSTQWSKDGGFMQDAKIKRVRNPFLVYMDPFSQEIDGDDARFGFVVHDMDKDAYRTKFGSASMASLEEFRSSGSAHVADWMPIGAIRIAEWWRVVSTWDDDLLLRWPEQGGKAQIVRKSIFDQWPKEQQAQVKVVKSRRVETKEVRCALINAVEILEGNEDKTDGALVLGSRIPIFPVYGEEFDMNGTIDYRGMVRDAKDAQRMFNYENSALAEALALAPKAPYIGYTGQFENHETKWNQANRRNFAYLEVNPKSVGGDLLPLPQRSSIDPGVGAIVTAITMADNNLKATMGMFDPSLGRRQGDQSGEAIKALQRQGEIANSNFQDNLHASIRAVGRYLVEIIPLIYDVPRVLRILGLDDQPKTVMIHGGIEPHDDDMIPEAVQGIYDLSVGRYDVVVNTGPTQATRRQEAVQALATIVQGQPGAFAVLGDLIVENMDWPGARVAAQRLKKMLPPNLQDQEEGKDVPPQVMAQIQQAQQQMQQMGEQMQALQGQVQEAQSKLREKVIERQMQQDEWSVRLQIAAMELDKVKIQAGLKADTDLQLANLKLMTQRSEAAADRAHEQAMTRQEQGHEIVRDHLGSVRELQNEETSGNM